MPNCDFYAALEDHASLLDWLFRDGRCEVFESYSEFEQPLAQFGSASEVLKLFERRYTNGRQVDSVGLALYVAASGPQPIIRHIALNPSSCGGATFRFTLEGWGLIGIDLQIASDSGLRCSHTNHNSRLRAEKWVGVSDRLGSPDDWDFAKVTSYSARMNREIRKRAVDKLGSRVVLPGAKHLFEEGVRLLPT
jgi:hypothetical protein